MDSNYIFIRVFVVFACYVFVRFAISMGRFIAINSKKKKYSDATRTDKIVFVVESILVIALLSYLVRYYFNQDNSVYKEKSWELGIITFLVIAVPFFYSGIKAFNQDRGLTDEERRVKYKYD